MVGFSIGVVHWSRPLEPAYSRLLAFVSARVAGDGSVNGLAYSRGSAMGADVRKKALIGLSRGRRER